MGIWKRGVCCFFFRWACSSDEPFFFCTGTGKEPMRQAFGGWAAIDGCFEARDTQKMGGWHGAFPQIPRPAARPGVSLLMSIAWR